MSDEEYLEEIVSMFNYNTWKSKEMIDREQYIKETLVASNIVYDDLRKNYKLLQNFENYTSFENYLIQEEETFDDLIEKHSDDKLTELLELSESRIGILLYDGQIENMFFKLDVDGATGYFALPKIMYESIENKYQEEHNREKQNEGMFI